MKTKVNLLITFIVGIFFFLLPFPSYAATTSYQITPGIPVKPVLFRGEPFFGKSITVDYQSGKIIFALNSDGTGDTIVDDRVEIKVTKPNGATSSFINAYPVGCSYLKPLPPQDITALFAVGFNKVQVNLKDICGLNKSSTSLYLVNSIPDPAPEPFLELPWEHESKGKSFENIVFSPNSWFDHKYPLQNHGCCIKDIIDYLGDHEEFYYKSHNGYDYGLPHGVEFDTPVLAAASGLATFKSEANSGGAGNVIKIDHGNGYQTWYEHLQTDGLIVANEGQSISVTKGQQIGKVGMTGNTDGPHIHFSVFQDSNNNDSFEDEIPYGVVDPLGWEGKLTDPWESWTDGYRTGSKSYNLFVKRAPVQKVAVTPSGGTVKDNSVTAIFPSGFFGQNLFVTLKKAPFEAFSDQMKSPVPSFFLDAFDSINNTVHQFLKPITLTYNYSTADLTNITENFLSFYYFNELTNQWEIMPTALDLINHIATTQTTHFSHFALMGELKDTTSPTTTAVLNGEKGQETWYRSDVQLVFEAQDNDGGLGIAYTLYKVNDDEWKKYQTPLVFTEEGDYKILFFSSDPAENIENKKEIAFHIDTIPPHTSLTVSPTTLWPPNGKLIPVLFQGTAIDDHLLSATITLDDEYDLIEPVFTELTGSVQLEAKRDGNDLDGRTYTFVLTVQDMAGNQTVQQIIVTVPHDQEQGKGNNEKTEKTK